MFGGGNSQPMVPPPPIPDPPPTPPTFGSNMFSANKKNMAPGMGYASTLLTSGGGLTTPASTAKKTLLGQ